MSQTVSQHPVQSQTQSDVRHEIRRRNRKLWFGVMSGPLVYSVYFLIGYFLIETACSADVMHYTVLGLEAISFWTVILTIAAAGITGYSTLLAYWNWKKLRTETETVGARSIADEARKKTAEEGEDYAPFMAFVGMWLSALFTLIIFVTGLPALFVVLCDWI